MEPEDLLRVASALRVATGIPALAGVSRIDLAVQDGRIVGLYIHRAARDQDGNPATIIESHGHAIQEH